MKWSEWLIAISLIVIGLSCLTMSATSMMKPESLHDYLHNLMAICMWTGIPVLLAGIIYLIFKRKKRD